MRESMGIRYVLIESGASKETFLVTYALCVCLQR